MQLANNARTILATGINDATTTIPLSDASLFPTVTATILTGTVTSTVGNAFSATGAGTAFLSELAVGDTVTWTGIEQRRVIYIASDTEVVFDREAVLSGTTLTKRDAYFISVINASGSDVERMLVMSTAGDTFTVARAQDGSTAAAFLAGAAVEYRVTAGLLRQVVAEAVVDVAQNLAETHGADLLGLSAAGVVADTVREGIEELAADADAHLADTTAAHAASAISFTPASGIAATNVQTAIVEALTDAVAAVTGHTNATPAAHAASAIAVTPAGGISATDVQGALEELDTAITLNLDNLQKIQDVIETSGVTYSAADDFQLSRAVSTYVHGANYWVCTGSVGSFSLGWTAGTMDPVTNDGNEIRKPTEYFNGMCVRFIANTSNSTAATMDVAGLGSVDVLSLAPDGSTSPAYWRANEFVTLTYSGGDFYKDVADGVVIHTSTYTYGDGETYPFTWDVPATASQDDTIVVRAVGAGAGGSSGASVLFVGGAGGAYAEYSFPVRDLLLNQYLIVDPGAPGVGMNPGVTFATDGGDTTVTIDVDIPGPSTIPVVVLNAGGGRASGPGTTIAVGGLPLITTFDPNIPSWNGATTAASPATESSVFFGAAAGGRVDEVGGESYKSGDGGDGAQANTTPPQVGSTPGGGGGANYSTWFGGVAPANNGADGGPGQVRILVVKGSYFSPTSPPLEI